MVSGSVVMHGCLKSAGPRGGERNKFTTIPEYRKAPPTS
jgi:hypothetical protein